MNAISHVSATKFVDFTARSDRPSQPGRLANFSGDAFFYDLFDGQRIEGHNLYSHFTKCPLLSLPLSHTKGGKMREVNFINVTIIYKLPMHA